TDFGALLLSVALIGMGSSIFHPESSRVAHLAAGDRRGFAQSFFQVGGNVGSSLGPLLAAVVITERARSSVVWFTILAAAGIVVLSGVGRWYRRNHAPAAGAKPVSRVALPRVLPRERVAFSVAI